jgi:hypothetical protein
VVDRAPGQRPLELVAVALAAVACVLHALHYNFVADDAFIAARYARNLAEGNGLVFQPGEAVEGFTSPLWVLWLGLLGAIGADYVTTMRLMSLGSAIGAVVLAYLLARRALPASRRAMSVYAPALVAAAAPVACWALGGLEQTCFALAVLAAVWQSAGPDAPRGQLLREGAISALCVLLRPEGMLVGLGLGLARVSTGTRDSVRASVVAWLPSLAAALALTLWRLGYYGAWLPNTATAKLEPGATAFAHGALYLVAFLGDHGSAPLWILVLAIAAWPGAPFAARAATAVACLLTLGVVLVGGDGLPMYRFFVPVLPLLAVIAVVVAARVMDSLRARARPVSASGVSILGASALLALAYSFAQPPSSLAQFRLYQQQRLVEIPRWREVGLWLAANTPPDATIACVPVGAIGYYSRRRIIDMVGLTDRHIARRKMTAGQVGHQKHDGPYVLSRRPDILLLGNVQVLDAALAPGDPTFGRPDIAAIRAREDDIFTSELAAHYEPRVATLPSGGKLHYFHRH